MTILCILDVFSRAEMSETARPRTRFMRARDILYRNMIKNILAIQDNSGFDDLTKLVVKSYSPSNIAITLMKESGRVVNDADSGRSMWKTRA